MKQIVELSVQCGEGVGLGLYDVYRHFQQYFSYIMVVSFICVDNRKTRKKPPTCRNSLTNVIT